MDTKEVALKGLMGHTLQILYMVALGIIIALFCGLGIDTFYPGPKAPEYSTILMNQQYKTVPVTGTVTQTPEELQAQKDYDAAQTKYMEALKPHSRNASIIAILLAIGALALSLTVLVKWEVIANGMLLGGIFIMGYSIILGMMSEDTRFRFFLVAAGVLIALVLGYLKFIKPNEEK